MKHVTSPENDPNLDKPDREEKEVRLEGNSFQNHFQEGVHSGQSTQWIGEEVVHKFQEEEENRERESRPKKPKKKESSLQKETWQAGFFWGGWASKLEKKGKRCQSTGSPGGRMPGWRTEKRKQRTCDWPGKLINKEQREKYLVKCLELIQYPKANVSEQQRGVCQPWWPYRIPPGGPEGQVPVSSQKHNVRALVDCTVEKYSLKEKADNVQAVIKKGSNTYAPSRMLAVGNPVIEPKYFIWVIQKSSGGIIDQWDGEFGDDQNIGCMTWCLRCPYAGSPPNRTSLLMAYLFGPDRLRLLPLLSISCGVSQDIEQPRLVALWMPMFCGVLGCFYTTFSSKSMILHAAEAHKDLYLKSKSSQ